MWASQPISRRPGKPFRVDPAIWPAPALTSAAVAPPPVARRAAGVCDPGSRACGRGGCGSGCSADYSRCRGGTGRGRERGPSACAKPRNA